MVFRATLIWLLLLVVAVGSGILRAEFLTPRMGEQSAHVIGTLVVVAVFGLAIWYSTPWIVPGLDRRALAWLGIGWVVATVAFEFLFGHYIAGHSWTRLTADYNLAAGRLWVLVLLTVLLMPSVAGYARR